VRKAFRTAAAGKPGPVYLDLPGDILHQPVEESAIVWPEYDRATQIGRARGDPAMVEDAIKLLAQAKRPVVLWGSGTIWSGAAEALKKFIDDTGIPFFTTPQSRGVVPDDHAYSYLAARNQAFRDADAVLIVGTRINYVVWYTKAPQFNAQAKIIRIDVDPTEIATTPRLDLGIVGDARSVIEQFTEANDGRMRPALYEGWRSTLSEAHLKRVTAAEAKLATDQVPIHPLRLCKEVRDFIDRDGILVVDGQEILNYGRQSIPSFLPGHRINSGTFGTMGVGLPYAIGAKAACPDKQVICLHGDGSFGLNGMELDTAVRNKLGVITLISLNGGWTAIEGKRPKAGRNLGYTRYDKMAEGLGCHGEYVEQPKDIRPALERANAAAKKGIPSLINVKTDETARATISKFTTYMT
jgi:acetolactate synthase-1/2/3 large subunit